MKKMEKTILSLIVAILFFAGGFTGAILKVSGYSETQIDISPSGQTVSTGETFTVNIEIDPAEPIAGAQCNLHFNSSLLNALSVSDGGMFDMWFNGILSIDNTNGTIENIIAFDLGGTTSDSGVFAVVTFQAKSASGTSYVNLSDIGISDENGSPVAVSISNGSVIITAGNMPPTAEITSAPSGTINYRNVNFEWTGSDDSTPVSNLLYSYKLEGYDSSWSSWTSSTSKAYNGLLEGSYTFMVKAKDSEGLIGSADTASFTVEDTTPPSISNVHVSPDPQITGGYVNISCSVTDDFSVDNVKINITYPDNSSFNYSMTHGSSKYYYNSIFTDIGEYDFTIWASDGSGNGNTYSGTFSIMGGDFTPPSISNVVATPPVQDAGKTVRISATVTDNAGVADVFLNISYPDGTYENFSITANVTGHTYYCEKPYTQLGTYPFTIYAVDDAGNSNESSSSFSIEDNTPPEISDVEANPPQASPGNAINISATVTDNAGVADVFLNISYPDGTYHNFSLKQNVTSNTTYYCSNSYNKLGVYNFTIYAVDDSGNGNKSSSSFLIKDNTPPKVRVIYPNGGESVSGTVTIRWNATDNYDEENELKVTIKYSADAGTSWHTIASSEDNTGEYDWNTSALEDGKHYLIKISVKDLSNNQGVDISNATFTVDNTKPSLVLEKPRHNHLYLFDREVMPILRSRAIVMGKITVTVNATDATSGVDRVEFFVDGTSKSVDSSKPYEWEWDEMTFTSHVLKVVAYDNAGNSVYEELDVKVYNI